MNVDNGVHVYRYNGDKMTNVPWDNKEYCPNRLLQATFLPAISTVYPDRPQSPTFKDTAAAAAAAAPKPAGRYVPPSARNRAGRGGNSLADRIRAEKEGKMMGAQAVKDRPAKIMGASGKVVVGLAPPPTAQGKSKSALRREKDKHKKKEEEARKALEEKMLAEQKVAEAQAPVDPEKRARKIKKTLKQIDDLKTKDPSDLNDDQKMKIDSEKELLDELAHLGL
jgi:translation initiation factor 2A